MGFFRNDIQRGPGYFSNAMIINVLPLVPQKFMNLAIGQDSMLIATKFITQAVLYGTAWVMFIC